MAEPEKEQGFFVHQYYGSYRRADSQLSNLPVY